MSAGAGASNAVSIPPVLNSSHINGLNDVLDIVQPRIIKVDEPDNRNQSR